MESAMECPQILTNDTSPVCPQTPTNDMSLVCPQTPTNDTSPVCPQTPTNDTLHTALEIKQERSDDDISNDSMTATTSMLQEVVSRLEQSIPAAHGNYSLGIYDNQCDSLIEVKGEFEGVCEEITPHIESGEFYTTFTFRFIKDIGLQF